ncbi:MAG: ATP-binding protein, partial [Thermostichales cyanobacterium SRBZ-1_bins_19]
IPDLRGVGGGGHCQGALRSCFGVPLLDRERRVLAIVVFFSPWVEDYDAHLVSLLLGVLRQVGAVWQQRQLESRYQSLFEHAIEGIFQTTPEGKYLTVNPSLARIYGYDSPQELMASIQDISQQLYVDPQRRQVFRELMETQGAVSRFESQVYRRDGQVIWISEDARAVRDSSGKILYYEGLVQDITAQRQAQRELEHSLSLLQTTLDATADGIISVTHQGRLLAYNRRFLELWQLPDHLLKPEANQARLHYLANLTRDPQGFLRRIHELYQTDQEAYDVIELEDGRIFERYSCPQYLRGEILGRVWSYRDVTEAKKIERLKNEFVSMVSHELRTPLTSIRGALGLIRGGVGGALPEQVQSLLDIADKNSERLVFLINDILDIDKIESGQMSFDMQRLDILPLAEQALAANQAYASQFAVQLRLTSALPSPPPLVRADPQRLTQVITNLLSNAAKFSPPGETVTLHLTYRDPYVRLEVIDRGPGIPVEFQGRIFQRFAQADSSSTRKKGGTGLGLSICKAIMERLQGEIGFESRPGQGTTFYVHLPVVSALTVAAPVGLPRVLVCEDDADIAHLLQLLLREGHFQVDVARSAAEAKAKLELDSPQTPCPYVAMTLDLSLPDQNGLDLLHELHHHPKTTHLPIVVVSASGRDPLSLQGGSIPLIDWLTKPIDQERLLQAIRQATRSPARPRILHIEDDPDIVKVVGLIVQDLAEVIPAPSMQAALQALQEQSFDLILLDWSLPDGSGLDLLTHLQQAVPVVVFSASDVAQEVGENVAAALIKSQTSNQKLIETIRRLIQNP